MKIADRAKQAATATSDAVYVLGAASTNHLTFFSALRMPTNAESGGTVTYENVPILVEVFSGSTLTSWQVITATVSRNSSDVVSVIDGVFRNSSTGSALGLTGGAACVLTIVPSMWSFNMADFGVRTPTGKADGFVQQPKASNGGLMALGPRTQAANKHAVAMGQNAATYQAYEFILGAGNLPDFAASGGGQAMRGHCVMMIKTADATPTKLAAQDEFGSISSSSDPYVDSGVLVVRGVLTGIDDATGDIKVWDIAFQVATTFDYATTALKGSLVKTETYEDAGATAWDVTVTPDSGTNSYSIQVTGEAATNITWVFTFTTHYHVVYP